MENSPIRQCILSDPEVGIVTENDHKVGKCLCSLCTCGQHVCPRLPLPRFRTYDTSYKRSYRRLKTEVVKKAGPYLPFYNSPGRMETKTSMQMDYQSPKLPAPVRLSRVQSSSPKFNFIGTSSYSVDYPDWGPAVPTHEKRPIIPSRLRDVKFVGASTYSRHYIPSTGSFEPSRLSPIGNRGLVGLTQLPVDSSTTHQRVYQQLDASFHQLNPRVRPKPEQPLRLATPPCHHVTTHAAAYRKVFTDPKDPAVLRRRKPV